MIDQATWDRGVAVLRQGMSTSLHCSIASVNEDGSPHVTPIGSLQITGLGTGMYFDVFNETLACNVDRDPRVSILVVNSSRSFWLTMLARGRFRDYPGVRFVGTIAPRRESTAREQARFRQRVKRLRRLKGSRALWSEVGYARDVEFTDVTFVRIGSTTSHLEDRVAKSQG